MADMMDEQFVAAKQRGEARLGGPRAVAVRYDAGRGRVVITLSTGVELGLAPRDVEGLVGASTEDLRAVEVDGLGLGINFPRLDIDLYVPALMEGVLGSRRWMAERLRPGEAKDPPAGAAMKSRRSIWPRKTAVV